MNDWVKCCGLYLQIAIKIRSLILIYAYWSTHVTPRKFEIRIVSKFWHLEEK